MSANETKPYTVVGTPETDTWFDQTTKTTVEGWKVWVRWLANGAVFPVRVPNTADLSSTVDSLARYQGAQLDALTQG